MEPAQAEVVISFLHENKSSRNLIFGVALYSTFTRLVEKILGVSSSIVLNVAPAIHPFLIEYDQVIGIILTKVVREGQLSYEYRGEKYSPKRLAE